MSETQRTTAQIKAVLDAWVPKYINQTVSFRAGNTVTADRLNELFNLLIQQGDDSIDLLDVVQEFVEALLTEYTAANAALQASVTSSVNALQSSVNSSISAMESSVDSDISTLQTNVNTSISALTTAYQNAIAALQASVDADVSDMTTAVSNALAAVDELEGTVAGYQSTVMQQVNDAISGVQEDITAVTAALSAAGQIVEDATAIYESIENKADATHTHDDRYYTETEVDTLLSELGTAATRGVDYLPAADSTNLIESGGVKVALAFKADNTHTHDDRYYTQASMVGLLAAKLNNGTGYAQNDYGSLGASNVTDANVFLKTGVYYLNRASGVTVYNFPDSTGNGFMQVMGLTENFVRQIFYDVTTKNKIYTRIKYDGAWQSWEAIVLNTAVNAKANINSPTFTGTPKAPVGTDYSTSRLRNLSTSPTDLVAGTSVMANGEIYIVYE